MVVVLAVVVLAVVALAVVAAVAVVVVLVMILSQTCNLRLTRFAMMSVWIR